MIRWAAAGGYQGHIDYRWRIKSYAMCLDCERYASQRDRYMIRMEQAVEEEMRARSQYAQALDDLEIAHWDREELMAQNAELRS